MRSYVKLVFDIYAIDQLLVNHLPIMDIGNLNAYIDISLHLG